MTPESQMTTQSTSPYAREEPTVADQPASRHAALSSAVGRIRVRRGRIAVDQILLAAAAILFPLGLIFILLGWQGAAHNGHTYAQIDYLISGGLFGLGLSVAGGFMYFGYWLSRQLDESRRQNALTVQALHRLEDLLDFAVNSGVGGRDHFIADAGRGDVVGRNGRGGPVKTPGAAADSARSGREADRPTGEVAAIDGGALFATPRGNLLHRPECAVVARRDDLRTVEAGTDGFRYCTMCNAGVPV